MKKTLNGQALSLSALVPLEFSAFSAAIIKEVDSGKRVCAYFGSPSAEKGSVDVFAVLADDSRNQLIVGRSTITGDSFPSITPRCPQVHLFEREIAEQFGLKAIGHPWFKPVRYARSWTGKDAWDRPQGEPIVPGVGDFYRVEGEQVHEVGVGPVHAGVIEPGHFRFQCYGEEVYHLEIALGYQHRGIEESLIGGPTARTLHYMETLSGDSTVGHATAYAQLVEALSRTQVPARAQWIRGVALELERLANHIGDLGALSGDVGFLPTASFCGRIRGEILNMTALLCGSRFGRAMVRPGGTGFDADAARVEALLRRLAINERDARNAINLLWDNQSVMARFEDTGPLTRDQAIELGVVGPAARATGLARDVRYAQPAGIFRFAQIPVSTHDSGDVFARAYVRWLEIQRSFAFIREQLCCIPSGPVLAPMKPLAADSLVVSLTEGWRGEICHVGITDERGAFSRYKVVDPSFHNWMALARVLRNQGISDFPICNKSFNLSYCGHDL
ncbi:MAG TPA: NADH-quinone oxidoreductase subunit C [Treponemataceae bacterium]|nr:NADH-quinone oxidoreductase subunit C [Treponemataceae bacterium]